ncbi:MAG: class I SAM-dependent methyltransferase [Oscillospiraceae bacterium]|nr:class I SAM-dependent methyltransferase [Oscillospiraceae bacterium]
MKMDSEIEQYRTPERLSRRISIHERYSVNRQGFGNWIYEHYQIRPGQKILELGCGDGSMWQPHISELPERTTLLLTDLSPGMLASAEEKLRGTENISFQVVDIQEIPCEDDSFDLVIANMMLYHVPQIEKALREVSRVLKPGGKACFATYGENGILTHLDRMLPGLRLWEKSNRRFTLQNGMPILRRVFEDVQLLRYDDALAVTEVEDIVDYLYTLDSMVELRTRSRAELTERLRACQMNGVLHIPKEYGIFICR